MKKVDEMEEDEYREWMSKPKMVCDKNYSGSSNAMEVLGVKCIWRRLVQNLNLRYTTFIGGGDTKSFANLVAIKPYGDV